MSDPSGGHGADPDDICMVDIRGTSFPLPPGKQLVAGRAADGAVIGLDPVDQGISRSAVRLAWHGGAVRAENPSSRNSLKVEYPDVVRHVTVAPGQAHVILHNALLLVRGLRFTHPLRISFNEEYLARSSIALRTTSKTDAMPPELYDKDNRRALIAIAAGYIRRWPRHTPDPLSYRDAAALIGVTEPTLRRRLETLRDRMNDAGVIDATGPQGIRVLVEFAIDTATITTADLGEIDQERRHHG